MWKRAVFGWGIAWFGFGMAWFWFLNRENVVVESRFVLETLKHLVRGVGRFGDLYLSCHPCITTTHLSYSFPMFETSATALCGTTGMPQIFEGLLLQWSYREAQPTLIILRNWYEDVVGARVGESRDRHLVGKNSHDTRYLWYLLYDRHASTSTQGI